MRYNRLGKSGLKISQISLGTNNFGGQVNEDNSIEIISKAIDLGINLIDTANTYTKGRSEEIIGKAVQGQRDDVIIATKVGHSVGQGSNQSGLSRKHIFWQIRKSLERLETDFIDIYYLHRFDSETPLEETLKTLNDLVRQGTVRYIACSNFTSWQIAKVHEICEIYDLERFVAVQPRYNLIQRGIEKDLLPYCQHEELGVLSYSPLMGGFLTGKYLKNTPPPDDSRGDHNPRYLERINKEEHFGVLEELQNLSDDLEIPLFKLAIAWLINNPLITSPIIGASKMEQIKENCQMTESLFSDNIYSKINEITKRPIDRYY